MDKVANGSLFILIQSHVASPGKAGSHILNRSTHADISALSDVLWSVR
jgi:hypothetical protein